MTKALLKKQLLEVFSWLYRDRKTGKNRSKGGIALYAVLYLLLFGTLAGMFFSAAMMLCAPLAQAGLTWLYFALMGLISVALGAFGSVFNTYSSLYLAKDNDLLLSMPIPTRSILLARLSGVDAMGLLYELLVMLPTLLVYYIAGSPSPLSVVLSLLLPLLLSVVVLTLSCALGWVVALISSRLRRKNLVVVLLSLAFLAAYYYFYSQAYSMLEGILANPDAFAGSVRSALYPLYLMGIGAQGNIPALLGFAAIVLALFGLVYLLLSRSFLRIASGSKSAARVRTRSRSGSFKAGSVSGALLRKELRRFLGSSIYMLNCGLGTIFMPVAAVALLIKADAVQDMLAMLPGADALLPLLAAAGVCLLISMVDVTSAAVSLEGKTLWQAQSLPVTGWQVLRAKVQLHLLLTLPPALMLCVCAVIALHLTPAEAALLVFAAAAFALFSALMGLALNLRLPILNWTSEVVPVKQGASVVLALFGAWAVVGLLAALYAALRSLLSPVPYLLLACCLLLLGALALYFWIKRSGTRIFAAL